MSDDNRLLDDWGYIIEPDAVTYRVDEENYTTATNSVSSLSLEDLLEAQRKLEELEIPSGRRYYIFGDTRIEGDIPENVVSGTIGRVSIGNVDIGQITGWSLNTEGAITFSDNLSSSFNIENYRCQYDPAAERVPVNPGTFPPYTGGIVSNTESLPRITNEQVIPLPERRDYSVSVNFDMTATEVREANNIAMSIQARNMAEAIDQNIMSEAENFFRNYGFSNSVQWDAEPEVRSTGESSHTIGWLSQYHLEEQKRSELETKKCITLINSIELAKEKTRLLMLFH